MKPEASARAGGGEADLCEAPEDSGIWCLCLRRRQCFSMRLGIIGMASVEGSAVGGWSPLPAHCLTLGFIGLIYLIG